MFKVTCSILCYNYGHYLSLAIDSCLNQEKGDYKLEVIVIDDGSTDNTPDICAGYGDKIKYYRSANEGFEASLTKAVRYASGDIICLLDADDYFLPDKINEALREFAKNSGLLFLYHDKALIDKEGKVFKEYDRGGNTSTQVFKKTAALDLLPAYNEQFFYTLCLAGRGKHLKKKLSHYRIHASSMSKPEKLYNWKRELVKMNGRHLVKLKELMQAPPCWADNEVLREIYAQVASSYNYLKMEIALNNKNRGQAFSYYLIMLYWDMHGKRKRIGNIKYILTYFLLRRYVKYPIHNIF